MTYVVLWEFRVAAGAAAAFERLHGPDGAWAAFFREAGDYRGTELLRDANDPERYVTVDRWDSDAAYDTFRQIHAARYRQLDEEGARLTDRERPLGAFTLLSVAGS